MKAVTIGTATLYCGDSYALLDELKADAMITDPPYVLQTMGGKMFGRSNEENYARKINNAGLSDGFGHHILYGFGVKNVVTFCANAQLLEIGTFLERHYSRNRVMPWIKEAPIPLSNKSYLPDVEWFIHAWSKGYAPIKTTHPLSGYYFGNRAKTEYNEILGKVAPIPHPTPKPYALMQKIVSHVQGNVIIDPFMGSGTTGIAAVAAGRNFIGIERNEEYFELACSRIKQSVTGGGLFNLNVERE